MDTPMEEIEWLIRIHDAVTKAQNEANKQG